VNLCIHLSDLIEFIFFEFSNDSAMPAILLAVQCNYLLILIVLLLKPDLGSSCAGLRAEIRPLASSPGPEVDFFLAACLQKSTESQ